MNLVRNLISGLASKNSAWCFPLYEDSPLSNIFGKKRVEQDVNRVSIISNHCFDFQNSDWRRQNDTRSILSSHVSSKSSLKSLTSVRPYSTEHGIKHQRTSLHTHNCFEVKQTAELAQVLERVDDLNAQIREARKKTNGDLSLRIYEKLRAEWTYHSNSIEGSQLSLGDTIFFLQQGLTVQSKPFKDFLDTKNHAHAVDYLHEIVRDPSREIRPILMKEINALLLNGIHTMPAMDSSNKQITRTIHPGQYKQTANYVVTATGEIHSYVDPSLVLAEMEELFDWINSSLTSRSIHPLVIASAGHYNMARIHPFDDGNGRGSRILMNLPLLKSQLQIAIIRNTERKRYLELLSLTDKTHDLEPFTRFVGDALIQTQETILQEIKSHTEKDL